MLLTGGPASGRSDLIRGKVIGSGPRAGAEGGTETAMLAGEAIVMGPFQGWMHRRVTMIWLILGPVYSYELRCGVNGIACT